MNLAFSDFWPGFNYHNNFFVGLFKEIYGDILVIDTQPADVLIFSCFGESHTLIDKNKTLKIYYTGENKRPDYNYCSYSFSFDFDSYDGRNIRLPLWLLYIDWFNLTDNNPQFAIPPDQLITNEYVTKPKQEFCSIVNNWLVNSRLEAMAELAAQGGVAGFGMPFGNHFSHEKIKYETISNYKFNLCFENTNYPGYHTEKLLQAKTAGCIPLYNGDKSVEKDFNKDCFFNLQDFPSVEEFCERVKEINTNGSLYDEIKAQPLFRTQPSLTPLKEQIIRILPLAAKW